jgi:signal transduction histidine kinase
MTQRHTILVVDDEADVVRSVQDLLRLDYRVLGATRAADGLRLMEDEEVHVVMTDQRMPEMTGVEFLRRVRGAFPEAVRLLITGYADIRAVIDAINQGNVYRYITKPWDPDELQSIIHEAADRYDLIVERNRLMEELKAKNQELQAANDELRRASQLREAFIRVASHELRTPVTMLVGLTDLAMRSPDVSPPMGNWLRRFKQAVERLNQLVDQLVNMLAAGQFDRLLDRRDVNLKDLITQAADDVRPFVELRHQALHVTAAGDAGTVSIDEPKLRHSLNHLLLNAIKFTPDGGRIEVAAGRADGAATIRVSDTGPGIDPQSLPRLFEPFFTEFDVSHHVSGHYEYGRRGIGLGLSVVKSFVEMHGGTIAVQSEPGRGAAFTITLPANGGKP